MLKTAMWKCAGLVVNWDLDLVGIRGDDLEFGTWERIPSEKELAGVETFYKLSWWVRADTLRDEVQERIIPILKKIQAIRNTDPGREAALDQDLRNALLMLSAIPMGGNNEDR